MTSRALATGAIAGFFITTQVRVLIRHREHFQPAAGCVVSHGPAGADDLVLDRIEGPLHAGSGKIATVANHHRLANQG